MGVLWVRPHRYQAKVLKYPLNENFLSLQLVILRSQLIFTGRCQFYHFKVFVFLSLIVMSLYPSLLGTKPKKNF